MQRLGLVLLGCLLISSAWAQSSDDPGRKPARIDRDLARHQAEVQRLQQDVSRQESASQQAAQRLQQQDRTIEELRRQLKEAQAASKAPPAGALMAITAGEEIARKGVCRADLVLLIDVYLTKVTPSKRKSPQPAVPFR